MPIREYTPQQALDTIMQTLQERDPAIADQIQHAIDEGKDVEEREPAARGRKTRSYRKSVALSEHEALRIAVGALRALFVEQPMFVRSASDSFRLAGIESPTQTAAASTSTTLMKQDGEKRLEVEMQTQTRLTKADRATIELAPPSAADVAAQVANLRLVAELAFVDE